MTIPYVTESVRDYGLGLIDPASMLAVVYGTCSVGTANVVELYNSIQALRDGRGEGPAVECAANILTRGGGPVAVIKSTASVAAANGAVTKTGSGPNITLSGSATFDSFLRIDIVLGGALGVGTFKYCLDGYSGDTASERTYSEVLTIPSGGTFAIPGLGVTLTFVAGTHVAGDFHTATVKCAAGNSTNLASAFTALAASGIPWRFFVCCTSQGNGDVAAHATLAASLQSQLDALAVVSKYRRAIMPANAGDATDTPALAASSFDAVVAIRCMFTYGLVRRATVKANSGYANPVTTSADVFAARAARSLPSTDLKRVKDGPLAEVIKLFHNEYTTPSALDDKKVSTLRTWEGLPGFYITQGRLKSPANSDFKYWQHGILMDLACETTHAAMVPFIGRAVRLNDDGSIDERDAVIIDAEVERQLNAVLKTPINAEGTRGHVTDLFFRVDRTHNLRTDGILIGTVGIKPLGYVDFVTTTLGYVPSLPVLAAA